MLTVPPKLTNPPPVRPWVVVLTVMEEFNKSALGITLLYKAPPAVLNTGRFWLREEMVVEPVTAKVAMVVVAKVEVPVMEVLPRTMRFPVVVALPEINREAAPALPLTFKFPPMAPSPVVVSAPPK